MTFRLEVRLGDNQDHRDNQVHSQPKKLFFSTRLAANTTIYLYILEYTSVLMVFHRLGKPSALWTSTGCVN